MLDDVPVATVDPLPIPPTLPPDPPECVAKYAQYLKDKYKRMSTLPDGDWPPSLGRQYTRLAMIEQKRELPGAELVATMERDYIHGNIDNIVKRKKAIQLPEIFLPTEDGGQQLKILMDGAPGVGKSTLSRKICKDWASGELLQQYHLVILLALRQASIREAHSIEDLIKTDSPDLQQQVVHHIQETSGEHILLILDGYDELSNEDRTDESLFLEIVRGDKFPKCSVLVTSRPYASDYLQQLQSINRHIEVLGFTEEQIKHCIMANIPDKAKAIELVQALKERQDIASLCYIPLNCAIVLYVYNMEQCTLPHSLSNLYEIFILNALKRHVSITSKDPMIRTQSTIAEMPTSLQMQLNALSELAYDGLVVDKMVFSIKDTQAAFPGSSNLDTDSYLLGLMTVFKEFTSAGEELSSQFLHLTIQEFLAARWAASQLSDGELLKLFQDHLREERYRMVLLFLSGISQLKFPSAESIFHNKVDFQSPEYTYTYKKMVSYFFFLVHLIRESQNVSLFHYLASAILDAKLSLKWYFMSPFDCLLLAQFLAWCDCSLKLLNLRACGLTCQSLEIMHRVILEHHGTTQIEEVDLSHNPLTKLSLLSSLPVFEHTRKLKFHGLLHSEGVSPEQIELHCLLNMRHLTTLEIVLKEYSGSTKEGFSLLLRKFLGALRNTTKLQLLQLQNGKIDSQNAARIFRSLEHNTSLEELDLSGNRQLAEGDSEAVGCAIERMLNVNRTLKRLNLCGCNLTDPIVKHILTGLTNNTSLVTLDMRSPKLSVSCAVSLFQQMTTHPTLSITVDKVNVLGVGRVKMDRRSMQCVICRLIPENCLKFFRVLIDSGMKVSNLTASTRSNIANLIPENSVEFFKALNDSSLSIPKLNVQHLSDQTAEHFAVGLAEGQLVQALKLEYCNFSSAGAVSIFRSLEHSTSLEELDLSGNSRLLDGDSEAVGCAIERMLNVTTTLKILNLSDCNVTDPIAKHILTGLTKNTSLVTLEMRSPKLSVRCAVSFFRQMTTHPTLNITVGEVNVLGFGRVTMDRGSLWCVVGDTNTDNSVEFFRALNYSGLKVSKLNVQDLTDQSAEHFAVGLAKSQSVQALKLKHCTISSSGAVSIFRSLQHNSSLEELDLSGNNQLAEDDSEAVGCAIERMLNVNTTLKILNLHDCKVTDPIAKYIITGLTKNKALVKLNIGLSTLSSKCVMCLLQQETTHPTLSIVGEIGILGVGRVKMCRGATLCITSNSVLENCIEFFKTLKKSGIKVLRMTVQDQIAEYLAVGLTEGLSVQTLHFRANSITSTGAVSIFRSLEQHTSLEELDLSENSQLAEGDGEAVGCAIERMLNVNRTLKVLNLRDCKVTDPIAKYIISGLTKNKGLVKLNIGLSTLSGKCAMCLLQQEIIHPTLSIVGEIGVLGVGRVEIYRGTLLCITSNSVPENCVEFFKTLNKNGIKVLRMTVQDQIAEYLAVALTEGLSVQTLHFRANSITSTGAVHLFRSLEHNTSLEKLDLSGNSQLAEGDSEAVGCAIERMLSVNRTLKVLKLSHCGIDTAVATRVAAGLTHNASLVELISGVDIHSRNNITSEGWVHLFKALCSNTSLKKLNVSHNKLGVKGSVALAEMLSCNRSLTELNVSKCDSPEAGFTELARGLLHNTSLKKLEISHNKLGMKGSVALAEMLSCNRSLTELNVSKCDIPEAGLREIARGLLQNTSLQKLDISCSKLGMEGSVALAEMLSCNKSLTELNLRGYDIPEGGLREIARGLLQNTSLQTLNLWSTEQKAFLEAEMERLKKSGNFTPQSSCRLEIKWY